MMQVGREQDKGAYCFADDYLTVSLMLHTEKIDPDEKHVTLRDYNLHETSSRSKEK